jgi:hypothetical protein
MSRQGCEQGRAEGRTRGRIGHGRAVLSAGKGKVGKRAGQDRAKGRTEIKAEGRVDGKAGQ